MQISPFPNICKRSADAPERLLQGLRFDVGGKRGEFVVPHQGEDISEAVPAMASRAAAASRAERAPQ
jgi:hypothetical protein